MRLLSRVGAGLLVVLAGIPAWAEAETPPPPEALPAEEAAAETITPTQQENPVVEASIDPAVAQVREYIASQAIRREAPQWRTRLPKFPDLKFTPGKTYFWNLKTNVGDLKLKFLPEVAPAHVSNFVYLSELGFFDGLSFHRVITQFMAQGGCPLGSGTGSPGYEFAGEFKPNVKHDRPGLLSMANRGPHTDGSQFFLTFVPTPWLDGNHTIFGETVDGAGVLKELEKRGSQSGRTTEPLRIEKAFVTVQ